MTKPDHQHSQVTLAFPSHLEGSLTCAFLKSPLALMEIQCPSDQKADSPGLCFIRVLMDPTSIRWIGRALQPTVVQAGLLSETLFVATD